MDESRFANSPTGYLVPQQSLKTGEAYAAYVPQPLPRSVSALALDDAALTWIAQAEQALGRLDGVLGALPQVFQGQRLLMAQIVMRQEAVASTRIEGTRITDAEAQRYEVVGPEGEAVVDYREVTNYMAALRAGQDLLASLPISARFLCRLHKVLLNGLPRGRSGGPHGRLREGPVIIGASTRVADARFVPPPGDRVAALVDGWADFVNARLQMPTVLQAALMHYQFETIHPFTDGNGRLGRLLVKLFFVERGVLRQPLLYLSGYLLRNRGAYYDAMLAVSREGAWGGWVGFFARGVAEQAQRTADLAGKVAALRETYLERLHAAGATETTYRLLDLLFEHQTMTAPFAAGQMGVTAPTARKAIAALVDFGILAEQTGKERYREYAPVELIGLLDAGS